jgi:lipooligosaccharide transport system permease protein
VYLSLWRTEIVSTLAEPLFVLLAMGFGLGTLVEEVEGRSYIVFLAPGLLSTYVMFAAVFECSWGTYVRMQIQHTFDAIIVTPVSIQEVITGELLWGTTRSLIAGCVMLLAISAGGWVDSPLALLVPLVAILGGMTFACISMLYTAIAPHVSSFNYFFNLFVTPMFFFSGVFFPLSGLPEAAQGIAWALPLTHIANINRALVTGELEWSALGSVFYLLGTIALLFPLCLHLMRRRLIP